VSVRTFSDWLDIHARRPILKVVAMALGLQFAYFCLLAYNRYSDQLEKIEHLRESVSVGVQQSNRPLIEASILSFLSSQDIRAVLLCHGNKVEMAYPPGSLDYCRRPVRGITGWAVSRPVIGVHTLTLIVALDLFSIFNPMIFWLFISVLMTISIFGLLMRMDRRFKAEILSPIMYGLDSGSPLAVKELEALRHKNMERTKLIEERARMTALVDLSTQVAHDIRSPLTALGAATKGLEIPADQRTLIDGAVGRMQAIANDLLHRYRAPGAEIGAKAEICPLSDLIEQVIAEKRIQHKDKSSVSIEFGGGDGIKAAVAPREFQRIISNLVNNAVEAIDKGGTVSVTLSALDGKALLSVKDDGKGIPPEILAKLCQKGNTHGKAGGTGLGLYHAKRTVEEWGGLLTIKSEPGKGTAVTIELPRAARSAAPKEAVLLDDDPLVHMNWKMAAKAGGVELKACRTRAELEAVLPDLPKDTPIFMDSDLGEGVKGEDIAKTLRERGFPNLTMATGHGPEKFSHLPWLKVTGKEPPWSAV